MTAPTEMATAEVIMMRTGLDGVSKFASNTKTATSIVAIGNELLPRQGSTHPSLGNKTSIPAEYGIPGKT